MVQSLACDRRVPSRALQLSDSRLRCKMIGFLFTVPFVFLSVGYKVGVAKCVRHSYNSSTSTRSDTNCSTTSSLRSSKHPECSAFPLHLPSAAPALPYSYLSDSPPSPRRKRKACSHCPSMSLLERPTSGASGCIDEGARDTRVRLPSIPHIWHIGLLAATRPSIHICV